MIAQALTYFGNDKAFEVIAILSAFVFGGINLFGLFRLSYRIGEATGKRESEMVIIHHDMTGLQTILGIIQTEMKMTTKEFEAVRTIINQHGFNITHLLERDKLIGERTHRIPSIETGMLALSSELEHLKADMTRQFANNGARVDDLLGRVMAFGSQQHQ